MEKSGNDIATLLLSINKQDFLLLALTEQLSMSISNFKRLANVLDAWKFYQIKIGFNNENGDLKGFNHNIVKHI